MAGETILVIDDNAAARQFVVESVLDPGGFRPLEAGSLEMGARLAAEQSPDLILLSARVPGLGPDVMERLGVSAIPVILMTAHVTGSAAESPPPGVRNILYRPFEPKTVVHAVERVLGEARLRRERNELAEKLARTRRQMEQQLQELNASYTVGKTVTAVLDLEQVLSQVVEAATYVTRAEEGSLWLLDEDSGELYLPAARNVDQRVARDMSLLSTLGDLAAVVIENAKRLNAVETERSKLEAVLRGTEDVVIVLNQDKSVLLCNPAARKAFNIETPAVSGRPLSEVSRNWALLDLFARSPAVGRPTRAEVQLADGRILQAQVSAIEGVGYAAVMQDITHLKELDRIRSEFVSVVSHDLRSPLTTIRGYVELLPRVGPLTPQQAEFVNHVGQSIKTITDLIGDLLEVGRIEAGLDQEFEPCQLEEIVQRSLDTVRFAAEDKRHQVALEIAPNLRPLIGNPRRLEQVITNLLTNAIKYTPEGGKIEVRLKPHGTYLMFRVADNGIGIPLKDQLRVFDKFYRVQSEDTAEIGGTGLGLSIVKDIVEKHGGRVWVESNPDEGSAFTVLLPAQP